MTGEWRASRRWPQLAGAGDERFVREGSACLLKGRTASARRAALVGQVEAAAREGGCAWDAREALVVCADPSSAARLRPMLRASEVPGIADVRVLTCRELACDIVGRDQAREAVGVGLGSGRPRILSAYEVDFVVEDVKTLGARPKRLREMLKFLYRGWTELADEDPDWLITVEEIDTFSFLCAELAYLGAVMEPQVSNLATKALRLCPELRAEVATRQLFVLDYQNLSRASQLLCQLVAGERLVAVADDEACAEVHESYPYLPGVEDFARLNPAAHVVVVDEGETLAAPEGGLSCGGGTDGPRRCARVWETPQEEIDGVADEIAAAVKAGQDPTDIGVMALHPWWARRMGRALRQRGVPANVWYEPLELRGDIRELDRCCALRVVTLLRLLADPHDAPAWRSWFGFGDYLTRSNQFAAMRAELPDEARPGDVRRDLEAHGWDLGSDLDPLFARARGLRGSELLACLVQTLAGSDAPLPPVLRPLLSLGEDADAAQMVAELERLQFFAGIPEQKGVVVASYAAMAGLDFVQLYAVGFVNGLFPRTAFFDLTKVSINRQERMRAQDTRTAHAMAHLGREQVCVSHFKRAERTFADRVGLRQARIVAVDDEGTQVSEVEPSIYTDVVLGRTGA